MVLFKKLDGNQYRTIGRYVDGTPQGESRDLIADLIETVGVQSEDELLRTFDGPIIVATTVDTDTNALDVLQAFDDGEVVDTPDGLGVIDDVITEGTVRDMEASEDSPVYAVVVEDGRVGVGFYRGSELSEGSADDLPGPENPEEEIGEGEETDTNAKIDAYQDGFFEWPESWEESSTPARIIALKAWAGMGGSFDSCVREMRGELTGSPDRFCADFKDRLYGTEDWRGGWAD